MDPIWDGLWAVTASFLAEHVEAGRAHLLTEDVLRFATILELQRRGIAPARMRPEYRTPFVGGAIDLVIDDPPTVAIEFKFPRDPGHDVGAADTMTMGELLKDFFRIASLEVVDGWVV